MKRTYKSTLFAVTIMLFAILTFAACSNSNTDDTITPDSKMDIGKNISFEVEFDDFGADEKPSDTRAAMRDTISQETVRLSNGLLAEITLREGHPSRGKLFAPTTRALSNDNYAMRAYQGSTFKGELRGTVSGGKFIPTTPTLNLAPGAYQFILYNTSRVSFSNDHLWVSRANALHALVGRTNVNITPTPSKQKVHFQMKHVGSQIFICMVANMRFSRIDATLTSVDGNSVPDLVVSHITGGGNTWVVNKNAALTENITFAGNQSVPWANEYICGNDRYLPILPGTNGTKLKITFNGGTIYNTNLAQYNFTHIFRFPHGFVALPGHSYWIDVRLKPNIVYLMSDGSVGYYEHTTYGGGSKTPIALVLSESKKMAIALKDAPGNEFWRQWDTWCNTGATEQPYEWYFNDYNGWNYTWDPNYVKNWPTGTERRPRANFDEYTVYYPGISCYRAAGYFNPGVALTGRLAGAHFYLPTIGEWKHMASVFNFAPINGTPKRFIFGSYIPNYAFTQVGGTMPHGLYYTSTEVGSWSFGGSHGPTYNVSIAPDGTGLVHVMEFKSMGQNISGALVRPFIHY